MREHMRDGAGELSPLRLQRRSVERGFQIEIMRPVAARHFGHRAEQAFFRTLAEQQTAIGAQRDEGSTAPQLAFALRPLMRKLLLPSERARHASLAPWAQRADRIFRRADGGA